MGKTIRVLLTGASGFLGQHLLSKWMKNGPGGSDEDVEYVVFALYQRSTAFPKAISKWPCHKKVHITTYKCDITSQDDLDKLFAANDFHVCLHTAAMSQQKECLENPSGAKALNVPTFLFDKLKDKVPMIALSTDQVYDGTKDTVESGLHKEGQEEIRAMTVYGKSKVEMESYLQETHVGSTVPTVLLRSTIIVGPTPPFVDSHSTFLHFVQSRERKETSFFTNEWRTLVGVSHVCRVLDWMVLNLNTTSTTAYVKDMTGIQIFHLGGPVRSNRFQMAQVIFDKFKFDKSVLVKAERKAPFPLDLSLDSTKLQDLTGILHEPQTLEGLVDETFPRKVVLVTGGSGLAGSAIKEYIERTGAKDDEEWVFLSTKDGDLRKRSDTDAIFEKYSPTHVIHLAAKIGGLFAAMSQKVEFFRENVLINDNVMECCRIHKVEKLVSYLSTCIYPAKVTYPINESMLHSGPPHHTNETYAYAKRLIDTMNRAYAEEYGCNFTSVIPTNLYGPNDNFSIEHGHAIAGLIHKVYVAKRDGTPLTIWGTGSPLRQFIYNKDCAELTVWVMREYHNPTCLTLSGDEADEVSIKDAALTIAKAMGFEGEVIYDTDKNDGQYKKTASNSRFRELRPEYNFTSFEQGIKETVDWFVENYESARK
ncbi:MAG: hypothetical protein SGBAC_002260 [Bacillariaceae sp.]